MAWLRFETPFGPMALEGETALTRLWLPGTLPDLCGKGEETPLLRAAREALMAYFAGERRDFDLVGEARRAIPYGGTRTYGEIAAAVGRPKAVRAVGQANHVNPLPIFIPCHRVVGKGGALTGYAGGLDLKRALLALESGKECL